MKKLNFNRALWIITGILAFIVSIISITYQSIYDGIISNEILPGTISQDSITLLLSITILIISCKVTTKSKILHVISLSIMAYMFYAYAIYSIEQIYNELYILYLIITTLSFYSIIIGLVSIPDNEWSKDTLPKKIKYLTIGFSIFIVILFTILWTSQLIPLMQSGIKKEFTFSIYILDLVFIMPAFVILIYLIYKDNPYGKIIAPILFFKAFTLLFSVGIGYYYRLFYGLEIIVSEGLFYIIISMIFLFISLVHFRYIKSSIQ